MQENAADGGQISAGEVGTTPVLFLVATGDITHSFGDGEEARKYARLARAALMTVEKDGGDRRDVELLFEYDRDPCNGDVDDIDATWCSTCRHWVDVGDEDIHEEDCGGFVGSAAPCIRCGQTAGDDYHLVGVGGAGQPSVTCEDCWDERLR